MSWDEFYNYYKDYVYVIVVNMGVHQNITSDLVQEIFVKAWKALPDFDYSARKGRFRSWICTITKNTVRTYFRNSNRRPATDYVETIEADENPDIDEIIEVEWKKFVVDKALENIRSEFSQKYLDAFMQLAKGRAIDEVAEEFDIPESTLYVYRTRIQKRLCREIKKLNYELD